MSSIEACKKGKDLVCPRYGQHLAASYPRVEEIRNRTVSWLVMCLWWANTDWTPRRRVTLTVHQSAVFFQLVAPRRSVFFPHRVFSPSWRGSGPVSPFRSPPPQQGGNQQRNRLLVVPQPANHRPGTARPMRRRLPLLHPVVSVLIPQWTRLWRHGIKKFLLGLNHPPTSSPASTTRSLSSPLLSNSSLTRLHSTSLLSSLSLLTLPPPSLSVSPFCLLRSLLFSSHRHVPLPVRSSRLSAYPFTFSVRHPFAAFATPNPNSGSARPRA